MLVLVSLVQFSSKFFEFVYSLAILCLAPLVFSLIRSPIASVSIFVEPPMDLRISLQYKVDVLIHN